MVSPIAGALAIHSLSGWASNVMTVAAPTTSTAPRAAAVTQGETP